MHDAELRELHIDRIYDTLIDEDELRACDEATRVICDDLDPRPYSSREFIEAMGEYLDRNGCKTPDSIVYEAYQKNVPIFCPAFSDCSAGFGLVAHQHAHSDGPKVSIDSAKDFYELTRCKIFNPTTGLFMVGGGVPKNFAQDIVVAADILGKEAPMHKYAVQVTVADTRDGALSGSTLKEASSWGKVDLAYEQMVYQRGDAGGTIVAWVCLSSGGMEDAVRAAVESGARSGAGGVTRTAVSGVALYWAARSASEGHDIGSHISLACASGCPIQRNPAHQEIPGEPC